MSNNEVTESKEEIAKLWKDFYDLAESVYPLSSFEIQGVNGEQLTFFHRFNNEITEDNKPKILSYCLRDEEFKDAYEEEKQLNLSGESRDEKDSAEHKFKSKAFIDIWPREKVFNFGVDWDYQNLGYGQTIYDNYLQILEKLGIEDKEQYELRIYGNPDHNFFKEIQTRKLVSRASGEPDTQNALEILKDFSEHPHTMRFKQFNSIIEYAINSNVPIEEIADAICKNGFNIAYATLNSVPFFDNARDDLKKFKSFGITGLKATSMHQHFIKYKNFGFMQVIGDVDTEDATLEFKKIFEEIKKLYEARTAQGSTIPPNFEEYGELGHFILDWEFSGLLFKNVSPDIKALVKKQAITVFDEFDPEHVYPWGSQIDSKTYATFRVLRDAGLMDKDAYIKLYQKSLNRNYNLEEFDSTAQRYISRDERELALKEISENTYYPSPKKKWQKSYVWGKEHKISKVPIPQSLAKKGKIRDILKQEVLNQGIAKKTKIKTDMTGITKDGKIFPVDNLKDWLFGVPGAPGNLQIMGNTAITFPPQTPSFAVELIEKTFKSIDDPGFEEK